MYIKQESESLERRCLPSSEMRIDQKGNEAAKILGYAAVFNTWTDIGGWFKESIKPGAFAKTIKENDIRALMNHDENFVLGRNKSGTLKLREDGKGLAVEIDPVPATWANDLLVSMRRGDVSQMSFGFMVNKAEMDYDKDERTLVDVTLFDVSVVTFPAYPTTTAQVRSLFQKKAPPEMPEKDWRALDEIVAKIKSGQALTEEEKRFMTTIIPDLSAPPAKHAETSPEPPAKHSDDDTRKGKDRILELLIKAEIVAPTKN